jgi:ligand-binding sensor domain-containing protein/two-component sensor histidine kinase
MRGVRVEGNAGIRRLVCWISLLLVALASANSEQLPIRTYTTADGLAYDVVRRIVRDSRGFLWFCTAAGLSRFDGHGFTTYGIEHGLSVPSVNYLLETRDGTYWVATNGGGVCRFNPKYSASATEGAKELFTTYPVGDEPAANRVNVLYEDRTGLVWAGTDAGLFHLNDTSNKFVLASLGIPSHPDRLTQVWAFVEDQEGTLWIGTKFGLVRRLPDGPTIHYRVRPSQDRDMVLALIHDRDGRLWLGHESAGLIVFIPQSGLLVRAAESFPWRQLASATKGHNESIQLPTSPGEAVQFTTADGLSQNFVLALHQTPDGHIWVGTFRGLTEFDLKRFRKHTTAQGLSSDLIQSLGEDSAGSLWIGTEGGGVMKLGSREFVTFSTKDGLGRNAVRSVFENQQGALCVLTFDGYINRFDGRQFIAINLNLPSIVLKSYVYDIIEDRAGEWWVATKQGLCRFPRVKAVEELARVRPKAFYTTSDGLADNDVRILFEDSRGDIWMNSFALGKEELTRWERATETFHRYSDSDGLPPFRAASSFCEDGRGTLWVGFRDGPLARYTGGRFNVFTPSDGVGEGAIGDLHLDRAGRLWAATSGGVTRVDDPTSEHPRFVTYTTANGLLSNYTSSVVEDLNGKIYVGTARGIDRLDPMSGRIEQYTSAELPWTRPTVSYRDRHGALWFGSVLGLYRFTPLPGQPRPPPPILIDGLRVRGVPQPMSELGETEMSGLELGPNQNQLQIDFFGLDFWKGEALRYQFKLEGADTDWSALTDQRSVNYASLQPGHYRFLVRAVNADDTISATPAFVTFRILPPIWQRWWFITLAAFLVGLAAYAVYRYRVGRLLELERVRTRIATDLHDDIGSSLSQIAILSEVARRQAVRGEAGATNQLSLIARISRESVDAMSDIVWAINPQRDSLGDLTGRMRRFAGDIFPGRDIEFDFRASVPEQDIKLGADVRRQTFLIFKECVNNIVRHSACTEADIELRLDGPWLVMKLADNGKGFDPAEAKAGHGLASMRRRAAALGGELQIASNNGRGTIVTLKIPQGHSVLRRRGKNTNAENHSIKK